MSQSLAHKAVHIDPNPPYDKKSCYATSGVAGKKEGNQTACLALELMYNTYRHGVAWVFWGSGNRWEFIDARGDSKGVLLFHSIYIKIAWEKLKAWLNDFIFYHICPQGASEHGTDMHRHFSFWPCAQSDTFHWLLTKHFGNIPRIAMIPDTGISLKTEREKPCWQLTQETFSVTEQVTNLSLS